MPAIAGPLSHRRALAFTIGGYMIIAAGPIFVRASDLGPVSSAFWRMAISTALIFALQAGRRTEMPPRREIAMLLAAGVAFAVDLALFHVAIVRIPVAEAALLANLSPIIAGGMAVALGRKFPPAYWAGVSIAVLGAALIAGASLSGLDGDWIGIAAAVGSAAFFAVYLLMVESLRARHGLLPILLWGGIGGTAALLPVALGLEPQLMPATPAGWLAVGALGLLVQCGGQGLVVYGLARLSGPESGLTGLLVPVFAAIFGLLLLAEPITARTLVGGLAVLAGLAAATTASAPARKARVSPRPEAVDR